ncbi:4Fe-4S dicluster domain-containing protein [Magnetospira thiophila]
MTELHSDLSLDHNKRRLLAGAAAAATMTIAPGVLLVAPKPAEAAVTGPVTDKVRWGLLIDTTKCDAGCDACVGACKAEHGWGDESKSNDQQDAQWIRKVDVKNPKTGYAFSLPMMCQHCENPPCADVCPTGASFKRADGIVLVDKHICIGCRYCMMACPYKARSFVHEDLVMQKTHTPRGKGTVESCNMCSHRVDHGRLPACVEACAAKAGGAMLFGDLNDPNSEIARRVASIATTQIRADLGLNPGVLYHGF